ncbi:LysE family translocator [Acidianus sulfidivorans JP7]|uniref:Lysine transporter LysE n=1 Tax=Acidianus sulfidivorans JP7 TaxID=619593 RepID=A0A2U9IN66_9CREN|nr:LysE family transporter [Acidianus sulfidivorans]AWR97446.1 LysE family translocator [Acidianus sulfidivorans JP7]
MLEEILGILIGLSMAAPPGPVNAIIANESLISKLHGSAVGLGAMTADFIFFLFTYFLRNIIPEFVIHLLYIIGGALMLYLTLLISKSKPSNRSKKGNYITGLAMGITNPYQITWWLTVGLFMIDEFNIAIIPSFFLGIIIWIFSFPFLINKVGTRYSKYIKIFSILVLLGFGIYMLIIGFKYLV